MRSKLFPAVPLLAYLFVTSALAQDRTVLPIARPPFGGTVGETEAQSRPEFPRPVTAPANAPNVLLVMTDDVGFGAGSPFGGPVPMPNLERLAQRGVVYSRFHTEAMCSPTRAALLTGRSSHSVGSGTIGELSMGYPGFWGGIPRSAAPIARVLRDNGYNTAMFGKEHNVPHAQVSVAGPFDQWPNGKGFEYFYGFIGGATNQFAPRLVRNGALLDPVEREADYILDRDLVDESIRWLHNQQAAGPDKPFFIYLAPGSAHSPHQAPAEWIARFSGQFDDGWDVMRERSYARQQALGVIPADAELTPRPDAIPAWNSLSPDEQQVQTREMEVFAAMLAFQDAQFGRLLGEIDRMGLAQDTLILFIQGDNGGTAEGGLHGEFNEAGVMANALVEPLDQQLARLDEYGGPNTMGKFSVGWGWATNTPFPWTKQVVSHLGGTRNPLVAAWPGHIPTGGHVRPQYGHVSDIYPTILEAAGLSAPRMVDGVEQQRVEGISLLYSFADASLPDQRTEQAYELFGNRAIYHDGWLANTTPRRVPWYYGPTEGSPLDYEWELYFLPEDFAQARNLAAQEPERLSDLRQRWAELARSGNLFPLSDDFSNRNYADPRNAASRPDHYDFWGPGISIPHASGPPLFGRSFAIEAELTESCASPDGVLVATGSRFGGWSFYIHEGHPVAWQAYSESDEHQYSVVGAPLPQGARHIRYEFTPDGPGRNRGGTLRILVDGEISGEGRIDRTITLPAGFGETFDTGRDTGAQVSSEYRAGGPLNVGLDRVRVELGPLVQ
jgi:arylsulfatase